MTHFCSKMHYGTICAGNKRAAEHFEICLPYDFVQSLTAKHTHTYRRQHRPDTQAHAIHIIVKSTQTAQHREFTHTHTSRV